MSILPPIARMLIEEHKRKPITGNIVTIGRQSVPLSYPETLDLMEEFGLSPRGSSFVETDGETVGAHQTHLTDRSFFSMFTDAKLTALDVSAYEGAGIVHDLNAELPDRLHGIANFIFEGSCLDNLFDPARAIKSMSKMLRPGGRILAFDHATPIQSAYLCYPPEWFWNFFTANGYERVAVFTCAFDGVLGPWTVFPWVPETAVPRGDFITAVIAEKGARSTDDVSPIQGHYRKLHGTA